MIQISHQWLVAVNIFAGEIPIHGRVCLIQDQFVKALQIHLSQHENASRISDILTWLPMLHSASSVLLHSKMFYVPFLLCKVKLDGQKTIKTENTTDSSDQNSVSSLSGSSDDCKKMVKKMVKSDGATVKNESDAEEDKASSSSTSASDDSQKHVQNDA